MKPKFHILTGLVFSILLYFLFPHVDEVEAVLVFLGSFLIDFDHYLYYVYKNKDFSLKNAIKWHNEHDKKFYSKSKTIKKLTSTPACVFHGIEIIIILVILWIIVHQYFFYVLIGVAFHLLFDIVKELALIGQPRKISAIFSYFKY
jgi:hypothetical protein